MTLLVTDYRETEYLYPEEKIYTERDFKILRNWLFCSFFFLATLCGMQDPSSPTRDRTHAPCRGSVES